MAGRGRGGQDRLANQNLNNPIGGQNLQNQQNQLAALFPQLQVQPINQAQLANPQQQQNLPIDPPNPPANENVEQQLAEAANGQPDAVPNGPTAAQLRGATDFPDIETQNILHAWLLVLYGDARWDEQATFTPSLMKRVVVGNEIFRDVLDQNKRIEEKNSLIAKWLDEYLRLAAPRKPALWLMRKQFITAAITEIFKTEYDQIVEAFRERSKLKECSEEDLILYKDATNLFRQNLSHMRELPLAEFQDDDRQVRGEIEVVPQSLDMLKQMLESIIKKRGFATAPTYVIRQGAGHLNLYADCIISGDPQDCLTSISKRKVQGISPTAGTYPDLGNENRRGFLLLATAAMEYGRIYNEFPQGFQNSNDPAFVAARDEVAIMLANEREVQNRAAVRVQQCANIDMIFNFYLYLRGCQIINGDNSANDWAILRKLNTALYAIGSSTIGHAKITAMLNNAGPNIRKIMNYTNNHADKHMAPFALTIRRVADIMVPVLGVMKYNDLKRSFFFCGISPRYFVHMRFNSVDALTLITVYWRLIRESKLNEEETNEINSAEHYFHQMLLCKKTAYTNSINKRGNMFGVNFILAPNVRHYENTANLDEIARRNGVQPRYLNRAQARNEQPAA